MPVLTSQNSSLALFSKRLIVLIHKPGSVSKARNNDIHSKMRNEEVEAGHKTNAEHKRERNPPRKFQNARKG